MSADRLYCSETNFIVCNHISNRSEKLELDGQVFFGVLAEVVEEFDGLGGELVDVVVELIVVEKFSGRAVAALDAGDDVIDALGSGVEARDGGACVVVERLVLQEFSGCAATGADVGGDAVDIVGGAVETCDGRARFVVECVVGQ